MGSKAESFSVETARIECPARVLNVEYKCKFSCPPFTSTILKTVFSSRREHDERNSPRSSSRSTQPMSSLKPCWWCPPPPPPPPRPPPTPAISRTSCAADSPHRPRPFLAVNPQSIRLRLSELLHFERELMMYACRISAGRGRDVAGAAGGGITENAKK